MAYIDSRIEEIQEKHAVRAFGAPLPSWADERRAFPNIFIRSALFGVLAKGARRYVTRLQLGANGKHSYSYTGARLDQLDFDILAQLFHYAQSRPVSSKVSFRPYQLLRDIGRDQGGTQFKLLANRIEDLHACNLTIRDGGTGKRYFKGAILEKDGELSEDSGIIAFNQHVAPLFAPDGYTELHWGDRLSLKQNQYAKWLHAFYCSHAKPYPYGLDKLRSLMGASDGSHIRYFKRRVEAALKLLTSHKLFDDYSIESGIVRVWRTPTNTQQRHLDRQARLSEGTR